MHTDLRTESELHSAEPTPQGVLFTARWATGFFTDRPWFSANRCMEVVLTDSVLGTRLMFPYNLFSGSHWGFNQSIPINHIQSVTQTRFMGWWPTVQVRFHDPQGLVQYPHPCLEIGFMTPLPQIGRSQERKRKQFVEAIDGAKLRMASKT